MQKTNPKQTLQNFKCCRIERRFESLKRKYQDLELFNRKDRFQQMKEKEEPDCQQEETEPGFESVDADISSLTLCKPYDYDIHSDQGAPTNLAYRLKNPSQADNSKIAPSGLGSRSTPGLDYIRKTEPKGINSLGRNNSADSLISVLPKSVQDAQIAHEIDTDNSSQKNSP